VRRNPENESERCVFAHVQALVNAQIFTFKFKPINGCDFAFNPFRCKIFNQLLDHLIFHSCVINGIGGQTAQ